jgi:hypothetical protein
LYGTYLGDLGQKQQAHQPTKGFSAQQQCQVQILGTTFLSKTGIKLNYSEGKMEWFDCSIPLHPPGGLDLTEFVTMEDMFHIQVKD